FIDELVLKKLEALRIPPSRLCTDHEFIRRAYLDAAGILPTPEAVQKFLADSSPDRRAWLIDALLGRPEFIDYWTYKWSDLFLVSTRKLPQQAVWAFHQYLRQSVADNKPWDRFARDILTATGSNLQNGAANYFVLHKDVAELTDATSWRSRGPCTTRARGTTTRWRNGPRTSTGAWPTCSAAWRSRTATAPARSPCRYTRSATCPTCAAACRCRRPRSTARHWTSATRATADRRSPTGSPGRTIRSSREPLSTVCGATSSAAAWSRRRMICGRPIRLPTRNCSTRWSRTS